MRKLFQRILQGALFCLLLTAMILSLDRALRPADAESLARRYFRFPKDTFDVVFVGSSLTMYGIQPMQLYDQYGIASYNLCSGNQPMAATYYLAREAIERDHPALLVLDCGRLFADDSKPDAASIHYMSDVMPLFSGNRFRMITDLIPRENWIEFFFPLHIYHSRWEELTPEDALPTSKESLYGSRITGYRKVSKAFKDPEYIKDTLNPSSMEALDRLIALCRETGTGLLLLSMPVPAENVWFDQTGYDKRWSAAQDISVLAEKEGLLHLCYLGREKELGIDVERDVCDGEHLNRWGAEKLTSDLGAYLQEHFTLPDRRGSGGAYTRIEEDVSLYPVQRMRYCLQSSSSLRHIANNLTLDVSTEPVPDILVLMALGSRVDPEALSEKYGQRLTGTGISTNLHDWTGHGWIAVIEDGRVVYETSPAGPGTGWTEERSAGVGGSGSADFADSVEGTAGPLHYQITSGKSDGDGQKVSDGISITVNGLGYALPGGGLQIAVFNKATGELLDSCRIDTGSSELSCMHDIR